MTSISSMYSFSTEIFGNPSEIRQELHAFENFPGSHTFFSEDFCDGFSATPLAYHSECGEMCLYEQDMLICLQNIVLCEVPVMVGTVDGCQILHILFQNHPLLRAMLSICLKLHGSQLKTVGFISTTDNFLGHIHNEFLRKFKTKRILCAAHHIDSSPAERFSRFVKMLPVEDAKQEDFKTLGLIFEDLQQKEGDNFNAVIANLECTCKKVMEGLEHVIHSWKCHDPTEELPVSQNNSTNPSVQSSDLNSSMPNGPMLCRWPHPLFRERRDRCGRGPTVRGYHHSYQSHKVPSCSDPDARREILHSCHRHALLAHFRLDIRAQCICSRRLFWNSEGVCEEDRDDIQDRPGKQVLGRYENCPFTCKVCL